MYPSKILDEKSLDGIPLDTVADIIKVNNETLHTADLSIMNGSLDMCSKFLQMEKKYNINNTYNFGFLPYYFTQKLINTYKSSINLPLNDIIESFVVEYIINTTSYLYTENDIHRIKLLLLNILAILTNHDLSDDLQELDNAIKYNNIIQTVFDTFSYVENSSTTYALINKVINQTTKILMSDLTMHKMLQERPNEIKIYTLKMWCYINNITADNVNQYKSDLHEYYDLAVYIINNTETLIEALNIDNKLINKTFELDFAELSLHNMVFPDNSNEEVIKLFNNNADTFYKIYIYTSYIIYGNNTLIVPSINDYDSKNGRTCEFLASKVYEDINNYYIYSYYNHNEIEYNKDIYKEYTKVKSLADKNTLAYTDKLVVINTPKFLTLLINTICPSSFHPSKYNIPKHSYCHFTTDKLWLNIYNIFNIDASYILVKSTKRYTDYTVLIDWAQNIQAIFKPLRPLWNYCYDVDNPNRYSKFAMMFASGMMLFASRFISDTDDCKLSDKNVGGDLYSIFNNSFYLIDFKNYELDKHSKNYINNTYVKTLVQCWLYTNAYYPYICTLHNNLNQELVLYKNLHVAVMNPLHSHIIVSTYDNVNNIITDDIRAKYKFAKSV